MSDQGTMQGMMNGAEWLARALAGTGMSHVFFVEFERCAAPCCIWAISG